LLSTTFCMRRATRVGTGLSSARSCGALTCTRRRIPRAPRVSDGAVIRGATSAFGICVAAAADCDDQCHYAHEVSRPTTQRVENHPPF
jgi:hypothetical protein